MDKYFYVDCGAENFKTITLSEEVAAVSDANIQFIARYSKWYGATSQFGTISAVRGEDPTVLTLSVSSDDSETLPGGRYFLEVVAEYDLENGSHLVESLFVGQMIVTSDFHVNFPSA